MKALFAKILAVLACAVTLMPFARAQNAANGFPARPIKILVGFAAGGSLDIAARTVAKELTKAGWTVVVENKTGASGMVAMRELAQSEPDGYTLMAGSASILAMVPAAMKNPPVDVLKDLTPIVELGGAPLILVVNPSFPANNLQDVIKFAKQKAGGLDFASGGIATPPHLAGELFAGAAGITLNHIAYRGEAPALLDVVGGHVPMMFANFPAAVPLIKGKKVKAIAVTSPTRSPALPDIPTVAESGLPNYGVVNWFAIVAPAGVPAAIVNAIHQKVVTALKQPEVKKQFATEGFTVSGASSKQLHEHIKSELQTWAKVVKERHITFQ